MPTKTTKKARLARPRKTIETGAQQVRNCFGWWLMMRLDAAIAVWQGDTTCCRKLERGILARHPSMSHPTNGSAARGRHQQKAQPRNDDVCSPV
jgi:hypothetical protein